MSCLLEFHFVLVSWLVNFLVVFFSGSWFQCHDVITRRRLNTGVGSGAPGLEYNSGEKLPGGKLLDVGPGNRLWGSVRQAIGIARGATRRRASIRPAAGFARMADRRSRCDLRIYARSDTLTVTLNF
jgi:hypothetical protein